MRTSATAFDKYKYKHRLFQALEEVNFEQVKLTLHCELSLINSVDPLGDTPLHKLLRKLDGSENDVDIMQIITHLLANNPNLALADKSGETILSLMTRLRPAIAVNFLNTLQNSANKTNDHAINTNNISISSAAQCLRL